MISGASWRRPCSEQASRRLPDLKILAYMWLFVCCCLELRLLRLNYLFRFRAVSARRSSRVSQWLDARKNGTQQRHGWRAPGTKFHLRLMVFEQHVRRASTPAQSARGQGQGKVASVSCLSSRPCFKIAIVIKGISQPAIPGVPRHLLG